MNPDPKDDLDRAIDEALASIMADEPRRVNAASVRVAMGETRRSSIPVWLAVAAALLVGLGIVFNVTAPVEPRSASVVTPRGPVTRPEALTASSPEPARSEVDVVRSAARLRNAETLTEPPYEGLPRLTIASIDAPEPLSTPRLEADAIQIPRIEIAPIAIASLSNEQEHN